MKRQQVIGAQKRKLTEDKKKRFCDSPKTIPKFNSFLTCNESEETSSVDCLSLMGVSRCTASAEVNNRNTNITGFVPYSASSPCCSKENSNEVKSETILESDIVASVELTNNRNTDPALWNDFSPTDVNYWLEKGPDDCQHHNGPFENSCRKFLDGKQTRFCSQNIFLGCKANGENYKREWLLYSPSVGSVYCFVCKLFSPRSFNSQFATDGFSDWRNSNMIDKHENSSVHRDCMLSYLNRRHGYGLTHKLEKQMNEERQYWKAVLQRVLAVIITITERGLFFRGREDVFGSPQNGDLGGLLELVARFDPFLAGHISKYGSAGKGNLPYVSETTCEELINLMSDKVRSAIFSELGTARYFSLFVDSAPDISHTDGLSIVLRYVSPIDGKPVERFITFASFKNHTGEEIANRVLHYLCEVCKVDFSKCRGQTYDDAANMSGRYKGMEQKFLERNQYAILIPCAAHPLNLTGRNALDCCPEAVDFFSTVQLLNTFFAPSTQQWTVLRTYLGSDLVLNCLSITPWEAHAVAVSAVLEWYAQILGALENIAEDQTQKGDTRREAENIANKMQTLEYVFLLVMWNDILQHFHRPNQALQDSEVNLKTCPDLYRSLTGYLHNLRGDFENFENTAKQILPDSDYQAADHRRNIRKKEVSDGRASEVPVSARDQFRLSTYYSIIDTLESCVERRTEVYEVLSDRFSFLSNVDISDEECMKASKNLVQAYPEDLNTNLYGEVRQFHSYMRTKFTGSGKTNFTHIDMYDSIVEDKIQCVFPNVDVALRIFLTLMITNCTRDRSFSSLKRLRNPQHTTSNRERLDSLSLLCMEVDIVRQLNCDEIIEEFLRTENRKRCFKL